MSDPDSETINEVDTRPTALITGASSGIGREFARLLASEGYHVIAVARRIERLRELQKQCQPGTMTPLAVDLLCRESLNQLLNRFTSDGHLPDMIINNAGFGMNGSFIHSDCDRIQDLVSLDFVVPLLICRTFGEKMAQRGHGEILNVASVAGFISAPYHAVYSATKSAFLSFSEAVHIELEDQGVVVSCLCPGVTETEFFDAGGYITDSPVYRMKRATAESVAAAGLRGLRRRKPCVIPGISNRALILLTRILPRTWVTRIAGRVMNTDR